MQQRRFGLTAEGVDKLHEMSVELLELLKENMPENTGEESGWKFEKAHSILHLDWHQFGWVSILGQESKGNIIYNMLNYTLNNMLGMIVCVLLLHLLIIPTHLKTCTHSIFNTL